MFQRSRPIALVVPLGLIGWNGSAHALEPDCSEGLTAAPSDATLQPCHQVEQRMGQIAQAAQTLEGVRFQIQPENGLPEMEWTAGVVVPLGQNTELIGGYRSEATSPSLTGVGHRWKTQAILGARHQWEIRPDMKLAVTYERELSNLRGSSNGVHRAKANLDYQPHDHWETKLRLEQRAGHHSSRLRMNARVTGQLSPALTLQMQAHHYRQSGKAPDSQVRVKMNYSTAQPNLAGKSQLNAGLSYEYRQKQEGGASDAHLLKAGAHYRPNWRWEMGGNLALRGASENKAALVQANFRHYLPNRLDIGGDLRWVQGIGEDSRYKGARPGLGATVEVGYHLSSQIRLSAGYALGSTRDQDFHDSQSAGPYVGLKLK